MILAHNYQLPEAQDVADFVGDSLELAQKAANTKAEIIVFCGVRFMAETAAILNPDKKVLMPDSSAGCPMADMVDIKKIKELKRQYPKAAVVCYINSTAEVKAESYICCTSSNAQKVVESLRDYKQVIFVPDKYLGHFISLSSDKEFVLTNGYCPVHIKISPRLLDKLKMENKSAKVIVHPECAPLIKERADKILSTGKMRDFVRNSFSNNFIIGTEREIIYRMKEENPSKNFIHASPLAVCPDMKKNNLPKILSCLENLEEQITVPENIGRKAKKSIDRMLMVG